MGKNKPCICWRCAKATNEKFCVWVETLKQQPAGVLTNVEETIIFCPEFEKETRVNNSQYHLEFLTNRERARRLNISERKYYNIKRLLARCGRNISVEEYIKTRDKRK